MAEDTPQKKAEDFENKIQTFLKKLKLKDINGGRNFKIGDIQIDACGGYEDTLLIVECKAKSKKETQSIRTKMQKFRGDIPIITSALKKHETYKKYSKYKYVMACKNIEIKETDESFSKEHPRIYIWDDNFIEYYKKLNELISEYSKYNLLGEMDVKPRFENEFKMPALEMFYNNYYLYSFYVDPKELLKYSYVARREIGNEKHYQRFLQKDRIGKIANFVNKGGFFPNNIIISIDEKAKFIPFKDLPSEVGSEWPKWLKFGILTFPLSYRSCWIIDGQHRLYSFSKTAGESKVPVVAFKNIPKEKQARFFIEINKEQKPVNPDLIWDLQGEMTPDSKEGKISNIVKELNSEGVFKDRIYIPFCGLKKKGQIKMSGLCTSILKRKLVEEHSETLPGGHKNPLYDNDSKVLVKKASKGIKEFFSALDEVFTDREKKDYVFTNGGISTLIILFERIIAALKISPSSSEFKIYLELVKKHINDTYKDLKKLRLSCTSEGGKDDISEEFIKTINEQLKNDKYPYPELYSKRTALPYEDNIIELEKNLRNLIKGKLETISDNWLKIRLPEDVYKRAKERAKGNDDIYTFITLGECREIIKRTDNWEQFKDVFVVSKNGFISKDAFFVAIDHILYIRNPKIHGRESSIGFKDKEILESYLEKINKCITDAE